jgi:hypothetical protein
MSAQEIIAELPRLSRTELEEVGYRLHELLNKETSEVQTSWGAALLSLAASAEGLPADLAHQHDHYLHGTPRR